MLLEADRDGWWYSSCDATGNGAAVYLSDADLVPRGAQQRERFFRDKYASTRLVRRKLPPLPEQVDLRVIDARTSRRRRFWTCGSVAIGDAAYAVDPLSGGGVRRALETAIQAAKAVTSLLGGNDVGALRAYATWAASDFERWLSDKDAVYASADPAFIGRLFWQRRRTAPAVSA